MPLIEIKHFEEEFSEAERAGIVEAVPDAMVAFTGEGIRPHTWGCAQRGQERQLGNRGRCTRPGRCPRPSDCGIVRSCVEARTHV